MNIETTTATVRRLTATEGHLLIDRDTLARARAERSETAGPSDTADGDTGAPRHSYTPPYAAPVVYLGSGDTPTRFVEIPADDPVLTETREEDTAQIQEAES